jgi:hypothetical protein
MDANEYKLLLLSTIMKRLVSFELPEATREAMVNRKLQWRHFFASDLEALRARSRPGSTIRSNYGDTLVGFVVFIRNQLVHQADIHPICRRVWELGGLLSAVAQALESSGDDQRELMPAVEAVRVLRSPDSTSEEGLRRLQELLRRYN